MTHLIITIELKVSDNYANPLVDFEANEAAKQAYKAARKALTQFTAYDENDFEFTIER